MKVAACFRSFPQFYLFKPNDSAVCAFDFAFEVVTVIGDPFSISDVFYC